MFPNIAIKIKNQNSKRKKKYRKPKHFSSSECIFGPDLFSHQHGKLMENSSSFALDYLYASHKKKCTNSFLSKAHTADSIPFASLFPTTVI